tara:strand:- start:163 stop:483 length:321 start_codon:yes stop_codon:yes gene_type:complete
MDYRDILGYSKKQKKKVVKEQPKPSVTDTLKEEFGYVKEVGAGYDYHKINKKIEKSYKTYWDDVKDLQKILEKKGMKKQAQQLRKEYSKKVLGFHIWFRGLIDRLL